MTIKKLKSMPYAQAHIEISEDENTINLFSYVTLVAKIEKDSEGMSWLTVNGLYSMTTRKHISAFMKEYTDCDYSIAKSVYEHKVKMCLETGEILPLMA